MPRLLPRQSPAKTKVGRTKVCNVMTTSMEEVEIKGIDLLQNAAAAAGHRCEERPRIDA